MDTSSRTLPVLRLASDGTLFIAQSEALLADIDSSAFYRPSLTTLRQPLDEMGRHAARRLLAKIEGQDAEQDPEPIMARAELVVRESTGSAS